MHEIQERVKRGEPKMIKSSLIPKGPSTNPSRNVIKIDALKFDIDKPRSHSAFDEIKINDKFENRSNLNNIQGIPIKNKLILVVTFIGKAIVAI